MVRKFMMAALAALALMTPAVIPAGARAQSSSRPRAPQNAVYKVYYYKVKAPSRVNLYGTYTSYASALRAMRFINSFPQYRAYYRAVRPH